MKRAYLITFESKDFQGTILRLKRLGIWAKINQCCFVVVSTLTTAEIRDYLYSNNANLSRVFVVNITNMGWASYGLSNEVNTWLKEQLRRR